MENKCCNNCLYQKDKNNHCFPNLIDWDTSKDFCSHWENKEDSEIHEVCGILLENIPSGNVFDVYCTAKAILEKYTAKNKGCTPIVETESIFRPIKEEYTNKQKYNLHLDIMGILPITNDGYSYNEAVAEKLLNYVLGKILEAEEKGYIKGYKQACEDNPQRGKLK